MALNRMNAAKGAALSLLNEAYKSRDKICLITFQGDRAQVGDAGMRGGRANAFIYLYMYTISIYQVGFRRLSGRAWRLCVISTTSNLDITNNQSINQTNKQTNTHTPGAPAPDALHRHGQEPPGDDALRRRLPPRARPLGGSRRQAGPFVGGGVGLCVRV